MTSDRKKPTTGIWIAVALVAVLVVFPLSMGPYLWLTDVAYSAVIFIDPLYDPLRWVMARSEVSDRALNRYCSLWRVTKSKDNSISENSSGRLFSACIRPPARSIWRE